MNHTFINQADSSLQRFTVELASIESWIDSNWTWKENHKSTLFWTILNTVTPVYDEEATPVQPPLYEEIFNVEKKTGDPSTLEIKRMNKRYRKDISWTTISEKYRNQKGNRRRLVNNEDIPFVIPTSTLLNVHCFHNDTTEINCSIIRSNQCKSFKWLVAVFIILPNRDRSCFRLLYWSWWRGIGGTESKSSDIVRPRDRRWVDKI